MEKIFITVKKCLQTKISYSSISFIKTVCDFFILIHTTFSLCGMCCSIVYQKLCCRNHDCTRKNHFLDSVENVKFVLARLQVDVLRASSASFPQSTIQPLLCFSSFCWGTVFLFWWHFDEWQCCFFLPFYHFYIHLVWSGWGCTRARDTSNWCTHAVRLLCVHCVFNLYADGDNKRLVVNVCVTQGTSEVSLRHSSLPNRTVILGFP